MRELFLFTKFLQYQLLSRIFLILWFVLEFEQSQGFYGIQTQTSLGIK